MARTGLLLVLLLLCLVPGARADGPTVPSWLADRADDARWLAEGTGAPRALLDMQDGFAEVVLYLPNQTAEGIVQSVMHYDVYKRTEAVETSFVADGAFFTGTRILGQFNPTVTDYRYSTEGGKLDFSWTRMPEDRAIPWMKAHKADLAQAIELAGLDRSVDDYLQEVEDRYDVIADVIGSHTFEGGFYRYRQAAKTRSRFAQGLVDSLGKKSQMSAALKAACYSTGQMAWAGPQGQKGVEFEARGNVGDSMRPSK